MNRGDVTRLCRQAEELVSEIVEGPLRAAAFPVVFAQLLERLSPRTGDIASDQEIEESSALPRTKLGTGTQDRILALRVDGFFREPKSLSEVQSGLSQMGFHYRIEDLGTPMRRLVQKRELRRIPAISAGKKLWKYSNY